MPLSELEIVKKIAKYQTGVLSDVEPLIRNDFSKIAKLFF
jgi:hypothetical protein